jgi:hypothetical protein
LNVKHAHYKDEYGDRRPPHSNRIDGDGVEEIAQSGQVRNEDNPVAEAAVGNKTA